MLALANDARSELWAVDMQSDAAREQLARWGIPEDIANAAGLFDVPDVHQLYPEMPPRPGIIIPYYDRSGAIIRYQLGSDVRPFARVRWLDMPDPAPGFVKRKPIRYTQPGHVGPQVYLPPMLDWQAIAADPRTPVLVTEGEAKGIVGAMNGFPVIALGGVYSFTTPGGQLLPELESFEWKQRHVYIVYDSDAATNPNVLAAEARLVNELQSIRGAHCHIVRLPQDGDNKVGMDDYILAHGVQAFEALLQIAPALSGLDAKVIEMNRSYAWISRESMVYDLEKRLFLKKDSFTSGELSSADVHVTSGGEKGKPKKVSVAAMWLKHPHAQRYSEILFRPGEGTTVEGDHGLALNMWTGIDATPGDVKPWLDLDDYLFSELPADLRELPRKLMAYKAQNPAEKIPLSIVLLGEQGTGKTVWADSLQDAFQPYGASVTPSQLSGEFQGWLETSLLATIHEMRPEDIKRSSEKLKALISDLRRPMNEKYRPVRDINSYTFYIITSNLRGVGSFPSDDRRMFVVDTPTKPAHESLYDAVWAWRKAGGGRHLMYYLLNYDLKGWEPPQRAPMTPAKYMAYQEGLTPLQKLGDDMRTADENVIMTWLDSAMLWAQSAELSNNGQVAAHARAVAQQCRQFQVRPWYTPEELSLMFPVIVEMLLGSKYAVSTPAGEVSRQLRDAGVPYLVNRDDTRGFRWHGQIRQYLVVAGFEEWAKPIGQADFERLMKSFPTYEQMKRSR